VSGRVLVVDDYGLLATGLQLALSLRGWEVQTSSGPTADDVTALARSFQPQCVLLDLNLGGVGSGIDLVRPLSANGAHVVMLTAERRRMILAECVEAGAVGWIGKGALIEEVDAALAQVLSAGSLMGRAARAALLDELRRERAAALRARATFAQLTRRESLVLSALIDGLSAEEIATSQFVALATVRSQIRSVLQKLGVRTQLAAVALASAHRDLLPADSREGRDRRRPRMQLRAV
jgi:two-component system, NarL family, nitrate/nitrite response regulator NarL